MEELKEKWIKLSKIIGNNVKITDISTKKTYLGSVRNISKNGSLIMQLSSGKFKEFHSGEIKVQKLS